MPIFSYGYVMALGFWLVTLIIFWVKVDQRVAAVESWIKLEHEDAVRRAKVMEQLSENSSRTTAILEQLEKRLDRLEATRA